MIVRDQVATGEALARDLADLVTGIEYRLKDVAGHGREVTRVTVVPKPQMTLRPGEVT